MTWGMVAVAGATVVGGVLSSSAAGKAANVQADAADRSAELQREQFERSVELQEPFRQGGLQGQNRLMTLLGLGAQRNTTTPRITKHLLTIMQVFLDLTRRSLQRAAVVVAAVITLVAAIKKFTNKVLAALAARLTKRVTIKLGLELLHLTVNNLNLPVAMLTIRCLASTLRLSTRLRCLPRVKTQAISSALAKA